MSALSIELPPNKACPRCGVENLATAARCLECNAPLGSGPVRPEEILRIVDKPGVSRPRSGHLPRGFLRAMSVPGVAVAASFAWPTVEEKGAAALVGFIVAACLAVVTGVMVGPSDFGRPRPAGAWDFLDGLLRGLGCLFAILATLIVSVAALFFAACFCGSR